MREELPVNKVNEMAEALRNKSGAAVMELRLFLKDGKIMFVQPIDPKNVINSMATGSSYKVQKVDDLREGNIREIGPVAFEQESPPCSFWWVYWGLNGWEQICLIP